MANFCAHLELICIVENENGEGDNYQYLRDNQFLMLQASDSDCALDQAQKIGKRKELNYKNSKNETVQWRFRGVRRVWHLPDALDGIEVASNRDWYQTEEKLELNTDLEPKRMLTQFSDERHQENLNAG